MPEIRLNLPAELYEELHRLSAVNELSLSDIGRVLLQGGVAYQEAQAAQEAASE